MNCVVKGCDRYKVFKFPTNAEIRSKWLEAIQQPSLKVKRWHGLCSDHFEDEDFLKENILVVNGIPHGYDYERKKLRKGAVPCIFPWSEKSSECSGKRKSGSSSGAPTKIQRFDSANGGNYSSIAHSICDYSIDVYEETVEVNSKSSAVIDMTPNSFSDEKVDESIGEPSNPLNNNNQSAGKKAAIRKRRYDIDDLKDNPAAILEFTGLENHYKFMTVFYSLGPKKQNIKIKGNGAYDGLSIENQFFLTLWKLRKNCTDMELAFHFNISKVAVGNIFKTWVHFMANQWSKLDMWPSRQLVDFYMPQSFREEFPKTRVILDGTEIHIERSRNPSVQQSTFSVYKNDTTLKGVVGSSAGGLITFKTDLYGGPTSDRQVVERSDLKFKCQSGDVIMADRGFTVQDIFAPYNVMVHIPHFMKGKGYLPFKELMSDRKLSKYRVHIERVIGLLKTYKILSTKLCSDYVPMAKEIFDVCIMLCNFKENIMRKKGK